MIYENILSEKLKKIEKRHRKLAGNKDNKTYQIGFVDEVINKITSILTEERLKSN